ncbi:MAG: Lytic transglycosylase catalytic [Solirubrobacterales bacterium]|nr:Lytic transglycosylase catalytic [Solirubrobacterales bacterium]
MSRSGYVRSLDPRRRTLVLAGMAAVIVVLVLALILRSGGGHHPKPVLLPGPGFKVPTDDPFAYSPAREGGLVASAALGEAHILFVRSPGGVVATAGRVARLRPVIDAAGRAGGIDPNTLEGIVFLESAGQPDVVAGNVLSGAAGLTQILAETAVNLLGMHVDLAASRRVARSLTRARAGGHAALVRRLEARRRRVDERFDPAKALAGTVRYLKIAAAKLGRPDLAVVSYHMGIGNLQNVIAAYGGGQPSYAQLYFDSAPDRHPAAWRLLASFGDESSLYYWKILAAERLMAAYRSDPAALRREQTLQTEKASGEDVLHPPTEASSAASDVALPSGPGRLYLRYGARVGAVQPGARAMLVYVAARVHALSHAVTPLTVRRASGWTFDVARRYGSPAQAQAFQFVLDRLTAENLIAWVRGPTAIHVTVSSAAAALVPRLRPLR